MEQDFNKENNHLFDTATIYALQNISKWTRLLSLIGFTIGGFVVMIMIMDGAATMQLIAKTLPVKIDGMYTLLVVAFFVLFFVCAFLLYNLYKASQLLKQGVQQKNQQLLAQGFKHLKKFFITAAVFGLLQLLSNLFSIFQ